jgi:hypothetical protein
VLLLPFGAAGYAVPTRPLLHAGTALGAFVLTVPLVDAGRAALGFSSVVAFPGAGTANLSGLPVQTLLLVLGGVFVLLAVLAAVGVGLGRLLRRPGQKTRTTPRV